MHEMALTRNAVDMVLQAAEEAGAERVTSVRITIGYCRDIVEDWFVDLFAHLTQGTIAEDAELILIRTPFMARCRRCGGTYHLEAFDRSTWSCPQCAVEDYDAISGFEFDIDDIGIIPKEPEIQAVAA